MSTRFDRSVRQIVYRSRKRSLSLGAGLVAAVLCLGCHDAPLVEPANAVRDNPTTNTAKKTPFEPKAIADDLTGLHNLVQAGAGIVSGSEPHGDEAFASLAKLGVNTIVSVDGARPDVEGAHKHGLRYVHIPIGYDGIPARAGASLSAVVRTARGPFYVHCHHGRHRGPAAAAVACVAAGQCDGKHAVKILKLAGTGKEYAGLWRDVEAFVPPPPSEKLPDLVEIAKVESLAAAMAQIDRHWDNLKLCRDANWQTPPDHRDLVPQREALLLQEAFHEAGRTLVGKYDGQFKAALADAESLTKKIEADLKGTQREQLGERLKALEQSCKKCHAANRN